MSLVIRTVRTKNYTLDDLHKLSLALGYFRLVINSVVFRDLVISHEPFIGTRGLNNRDVYQTIMSGREMGTPVDNSADLDLTLISQFSDNAIGYTMGRRIFTFRNKFNELSTGNLAGHYAHEYCHTLGFSDPADMNLSNKNVPYEIGRIIGRLASDNSIEINIS